MAEIALLTLIKRSSREVRYDEKEEAVFVGSASNSTGRLNASEY